MAVESRIARFMLDSASIERQPGLAG